MRSAAKFMRMKTKRDQYERVSTRDSEAFATRGNVKCLSFHDNIMSHNLLYI